MAEQEQTTEDDRRVQIPVRLEAGLCDRLDRIIFWTGQNRTKQSLLSEAVEALVSKIEREENNSRPFRPIPESQKPKVARRRKKSEAVPPAEGQQS